MEKKYEKIMISKEFADEAQRWLDSENPREKEGIDTLTANFGNGMEADIKICYGQNNTYVDSVLFKDGHEVCVAEPGYEVLGPTHFEYEGIEYIVDVELAPERVVKKIFLTKAEAAEIQRGLDAENDTLTYEDVPFIGPYVVAFGMGIEANISICFEEGSVYINPILFVDDCEVQCLDAGYQLFEEYEFDYDGVEYVVEFETLPSTDMKQALEVDKVTFESLRKFMSSRYKEPPLSGYHRLVLYKEFGYDMTMQLVFFLDGDVPKVQASLLDRDCAVVDNPPIDYLPMEFRIEYDDISWTLLLEAEA